MKKVIIKKSSSEIEEHLLYEKEPIFAKRDGKLCGMVVKEREKGWILRIGGQNGVSGYHPTRKDCMIDAEEYRYEFFVED